MLGGAGEADADEVGEGFLRAGGGGDKAPAGDRAGLGRVPALGLVGIGAGPRVVGLGAVVLQRPLCGDGGVERTAGAGRGDLLVIVEAVLPPVATVPARGVDDLQAVAGGLSVGLGGTPLDLAGLLEPVDGAAEGDAALNSVEPDVVLVGPIDGGEDEGLVDRQAAGGECVLGAWGSRSRDRRLDTWDWDTPVRRAMSRCPSPRSASKA